MAEKSATAMSLNERHKRLLQDFSASQHRSVHAPADEPKTEPRTLFTTSSNHVPPDTPNLFGIMDFDSPLSQSSGISDENRNDRDSIVKGSKFELISDSSTSTGLAVDSISATEGDQFVDCEASSNSPEECKTFSEEDDENVSHDDLSSDLEYLSDEKTKGEKIEETCSLNQIQFGGEGKDEVKQMYDSAGSSFSLSPDPSDVKPKAEKKQNETDEGDKFVKCRISSNPPDIEKPRKVKLQGRRRLCKASSNHSRDKNSSDEPTFSEITDFSSPHINDSNDPSFSGNEGFDSPPTKIRDILDDLSSKLDSLSIQKKKITKVETISDSPIPIAKVEAHQLQRDGNGGVKHEYENAGSSVSSIPNPSGAVRNFPVKFEVPRAKNEDEGDNFNNCVGNAKKVNEIQKKDFGIKKTEKSSKDDRIKKFGKSALKENIMVVSDEDDDPYILLGGANPSRKTPSSSYRPKDQAKGFIPLGTPKDSANGEWVFEDGDSIVLNGKPSNYVLPGKIAKILYPHQRNGLRWLWSLHCKGTGGILGDDMGLGKTMQICSFLAGLFHSGLIKRVMVVAPKTLLPHWIKELTAVGLSQKIKEYFGACAKARQYELQYIFQDKGILLTTYDIVRNNFKSLRGDSYFLDEEAEDSIIWDYTILDEGHIIKNPSTQRAKSLLEIPCAHRIIISGTPMQNNLKELWALFSFCCPELLGDKKEFKAKYESAILRGNEKNATEREKRIGSTVAKELRDRIEPYFLRRMKSEVFVEGEATDGAKLSKKNEIIVWLRLTQCQRQLYEAFLNSELVLSSFVGSPLAALTVLKKICDHPYLLTKRAAEDVLEGMETMLNQDETSILEKMAQHLANATDSIDFQNLIDNVSCKITFILSLLDNLIPEGHSILIFSQTRKMLNFVQEAIISKGYKFLRIDGTTKISDREKIVNDFQEGEGAPIFLLTSQVGGLGLTLTKADRVIVVDPAWNPSTDNQSVDRAYRIGQKKDVVVYRLMTCGTIEEKIYRMQVFKGGLFRSATEHKEQTRYFSQQDLRELFSLPKEGFDVSITQKQMDEEHDQYHIMDDALTEHIEFLKSHDIGGVSHHSLLFSKTAPVQVLEENEMRRMPATTFGPYSASNSSIERNVDGAELALNPKDVTVWKKNTAVVTPDKMTESVIRDKIQRLQQTYANKAMIARLPDKGEKISKQIVDLNLELEKMRKAKDSAPEIIDLDDISGKFGRVHV